MKKFILWSIVLYMLIRIALAGVDYIIATAKADGDQHLEKIEQIEGGE